MIINALCRLQAYKLKKMLHRNIDITSHLNNRTIFDFYAIVDTNLNIAEQTH